MSRKRRDLILGCIGDAVTDLLYYDRKDDEELSRGEIEAAIEAKELTVDEMVERFRTALQKELGR